jgi:hypothetical protein
MKELRSGFAEIKKNKIKNTIQTSGTRPNAAAKQGRRRRKTKQERARIRAAGGQSSSWL